MNSFLSQSIFSIFLSKNPSDSLTRICKAIEYADVKRFLSNELGFQEEKEKRIQNPNFSKFSKGNRDVLSIPGKQKQKRWRRMNLRVRVGGSSTYSGKSWRSLVPANTTHITVVPLTRGRHHTFRLVSETISILEKTKQILDAELNYINSIQVLGIPKPFFYLFILNFKKFNIYYLSLP